MSENKLPELVLMDDGTLDTVFKCHDCGATLTFYSVERDEHGMVTVDGMTYAQERHAEEDGCEKVSI